MHVKKCICHVSTINQMVFILEIDVLMDSGDQPDIEMKRTIKRFMK